MTKDGTIIQGHTDTKHIPNGYMAARALDARSMTDAFTIV